MAFNFSMKTLLVFLAFLIGAILSASAVFTFFSAVLLAFLAFSLSFWLGIGAATKYRAYAFAFGVGILLGILILLGPTSLVVLR